MIGPAASVASAAGLGCFGCWVGVLCCRVGVVCCWVGVLAVGLGCFAAGLGWFLQSGLSSGRAGGQLAADRGCLAADWVVLP